MAILWLIIGFLIGLAVAWYYLGGRTKMLSGEGEAEASRQIGAGETAIAYNQDSDQLEKLQEQVRQRDGDISRLEADLADCRAKAANPPTTGASAAAAPAFAASSPTSSAPASGTGDDLTKIKGIGQVLQGKLNALGITTFRQIAEFTEADIERVNGKLDFPGRIEREGWVDQAKDFVGR